MNHFRQLKRVFILVNTQMPFFVSNLNLLRQTAFNFLYINAMFKNLFKRKTFRGF